MPLGYIVYPELKLLFIRGTGVITQPERVSTLLSWLRDPGYAECVDALFDVSSAQSTPKVAELRELIAILRQQGGDAGPRRLAVVTSKPIAYGVAQLFGFLLQTKDMPLQVKVFLDAELAWAWLRPATPPFEMR